MLFLDESNHKPNKVWVDKGSKFYSRSMKSLLQNNDVEMYSAHNEGKSVIAERFIKTLKNKIYEYLTSISSNIYIDKSEDIDKKYNNTYHTTIKMKRVIIKSNTNIDCSNEINDKNPKFEIGDIVRILKYKNIFEIVCTPNWSDEVFILKKLKILCCGHMLLMILTVKKLLEYFTKKNWKQIKEKFIIEKVIKRKVSKLYVEWKGYNIRLIVGLVKKTWL